MNFEITNVIGLSLSRWWDAPLPIEQLKRAATPRISVLDFAQLDVVARADGETDKDEDGRPSYILLDNR